MSDRSKVQSLDSIPLRSGLSSSSDKEATLISVDLKAKVASSGALLDMTQKYINNHDETIDVTYIFPILVRSCITDFIAVVDDYEFFGVVAKKEEVQERVQQLQKRGITNVTAETLRNMRDLVRISIGSLKSKQRIAIQIKFTLPIEAISQRVYRLIIPNLVLARYGPARVPASKADGEKTAAQEKEEKIASRLTDDKRLLKFTDGSPYTMTFSFEALKSGANEMIKAETYSLQSDDFKWYEDNDLFKMELQDDRTFVPNQDIEIVFTRNQSQFTIVPEKAIVEKEAQTFVGSSYGYLQQQTDILNKDGIGSCAMANFFIKEKSSFLLTK